MDKHHKDEDVDLPQAENNNEELEEAFEKWEDVFGSKPDKKNKKDHKEKK